MKEENSADVDKKKEKEQAFAASLLKAGRFLPFGLFGSRYKRNFPKIAVPAADCPYLVAKEFFDVDEEELFKRIAAAFARDTYDLNASSGLNQSEFQDPHWGHTTGYVHGTLKIDNVSALPEKFQLGLFGQDRDYPVIGRPNFLYNEDPRIAISRLSIKLKYPEAVPNVYAESGTANELDLLLSEGLRQNLHGDQDGQGFFFRDARQMSMLQDMDSGMNKKLSVLLNSVSGRVLVKWKNIFEQNTDNLYVPQQSNRGWFEKHYFSAGPYALGNGAMKFTLKPMVEPTSISSEPIAKNPAIDQKNSLLEWLKAGEKAVFELCVQIATSDSIPKPQDGEQTLPGMNPKLHLSLLASLL